MTGDAIEQYLPGDTCLHRAAPVVKLCGCLALVFCLVLCPNSRWERLLALSAAPLLGAFVARTSPRWLLLRVAVVMPFVGLAAVSLPFVPAQPGEAPVCLPGTPIALSPAAMGLFGAVLLKSTLCALTVALLLATTGFHRVLGALQLLRMPGLFVSLLCFMYRYLFVLWDETVRLTRARDSRAPRQPALARLSAAGNLAGALFIRSYERAERVAHAMVSRGFTGTVRLGRQPAGTAGQWATVLGLAAVCVCVVVWR